MNQSNKMESKSKGVTSPISWIYRAHSNKRQVVNEALIRETFDDVSDEDDLEQQVPEVGHARQPSYTARQNSNGLYNDNHSDVASEITSMSNIHPGKQHGEARIVAPNVSKLSPHSAVEVRLQSATECVAVLCSVDVLKMRSGFFHDVLAEQEAQRESQPTSAQGIPELDPNLLWRLPLVVPEVSPFEAAAYLESLHEGRALFKGEWNFCWARLSVTWMIEDLLLEYASQIEQQMNRLVNVIEQHHWRTNPAVLAGMRVAVFRKGSNPLPTIVTGIALECLSAIGYSKLRIAFDADKAYKITSSPRRSVTEDTHYNTRHSIVPSSNGSVCGSVNSTVPEMPAFTPRGKEWPIRPMELSPNSSNQSRSRSHNNHHHNISQSSSHHTPVRPPFSSATSVVSSNTATDGSVRHTPPPAVIGDVAEPFWVQPIQENAAWCDPDELFLQHAKQLITHTDKRMFWEMARALLELPELSMASSQSKIRTAKDLTAVLKRPEFRVLWLEDAAQHLPAIVTTELIKSAYVVPVDENK